MSVVQKNTSEASKWYLPGILVGLGITAKHLVSNLLNKKQMLTLNYPEQKYEYSPRFKGNHVLTVKKDGSLRCTACMLCATNCPAECITIVASEHDNPTVEK
ncbi:MAG: NADH-quinone oxidoreductase subunit I, partial [Pseudobdellovibrionaceae bacterium]